MASKRSGKAERPSFGVPTDEEAQRRWDEFMTKLSLLSEHVEKLRMEMHEGIELLQLLVCAMRDAAAITDNPLLKLAQKAFNMFREARQEHAGRRADGA